jgi:hypothetical protein
VKFFAKYPPPLIGFLLPTLHAVGWGNRQLSSLASSQGDDAMDVMSVPFLILRLALMCLFLFLIGKLIREIVAGLTPPKAVAWALFFAALAVHFCFWEWDFNREDGDGVAWFVCPRATLGRNTADAGFWGIVAQLLLISGGNFHDLGQGFSFKDSPSRQHFLKFWSC